MDSLPVGTPVRCGNRAGYVHKAELERDQRGAPIMLHTINFTLRAKRLGGGRVKWEAVTPKLQSVNYAGITY